MHYQRNKSSRVALIWARSMAASRLQLFREQDNILTSHLHHRTTSSCFPAACILADSALNAKDKFRGQLPYQCNRMFKLLWGAMTALGVMKSDYSGDCKEWRFPSLITGHPVFSWYNNFLTGCYYSVVLHVYCCHNIDISILNKASTTASIPWHFYMFSLLNPYSSNSGDWKIIY